MESPNPRRRQISINPPTLISEFGIKKGATFHCPSSPKSQETDPILSISTLPGRSSTCARDLEAALAAGQSRIASILGAVDRSFSDLSTFSKDSQETILVEPEPLPSFMIGAVDQHVSKDVMDIDAPAPRRKHHASDSGIGSTETSEASVVDQKTATPSHIQSGINGNSAATPPAGFTAQQALSEYACRQIQKHIILPIIREEKLKPFHSLVHGLPYRVARKEITCLRDLEKVILWLAPKWSTSRKSFLLFCETSIQCIHTTVEHLSGSDLARPTDRPYTNGYFLDLVEQVRQYAAIMSAERARAASSGQTANAPNKTEKLSLVGGLSQTGRPAELVRTVDGKAISLRTGEPVNMEDYKTGLKRSFEDDLDDDLERSMARRKKNAIRVDQLCQECGKAFKRPCDLTKHEKTHSRPWKCAEVGCKYNTYGWPTEKERDRHQNDKHSAAPKMYRCSYTPCPYESKRESNCKQHMEKAHGYIYIRAKNNGKNPAASTVGVPTTPQMSTPGSHAFSAPTPDYSDVQSINESLDDNFDFTGMPTMRYLQQATNFSEIFGPAGNEFNFADPPPTFDYAEAGPSNTHRGSYDSNAVSPPAEENSIFGSNFDWSNTNFDTINYNASLPTPALTHEPGLTSSAPSVNQSPPPCLSPNGHGDAMLFSPMNHISHEFNDEGYSELTQGFQPIQDFSLYNGVSSNMSQGMEMFGSLSNYEKNSQMIDSQMVMFDELM